MGSMRHPQVTNYLTNHVAPYLQIALAGQWHLGPLKKKRAGTMSANHHQAFCFAKHKGMVGSSIRSLLLQLSLFRTPEIPTSGATPPLAFLVSQGKSSSAPPER